MKTNAMAITAAAPRIELSLFTDAPTNSGRCRPAASAALHPRDRARAAASFAGTPAMAERAAFVTGRGIARDRPRTHRAANGRPLRRDTAWLRGSETWQPRRIV